MLSELRIRNLAIIDSVAVPFAPGLNVLTGETGAGKSILVDALMLLLGERTPPGEAIRAGAGAASLEAVFTVPRKGPLAPLLQEHGVHPEAGRLIVRRELVRGGRGRVFLNDASATLGLLERLGETLVELHGQHEHQTLLRPGRPLELLDAFGGLTILRDRLRQRYEEWHVASAELARLRETARDEDALVGRARADLAEIDGARLVLGEEEALREERRRLLNAERLAEGALAACAALYDESTAALPRLSRSTAALRELSRVDRALDPVVQALEGAAVQLDEAVRTLRGYRDGLSFDPGRLEQIEQRLDALGRLKRKHGDSVEAVLAARERIAGELSALGQGEERTAELIGRADKLRAELATRAVDLSGRREQAASRLETLAAAELAQLELDQAVFKVRLARETASAGELAAGPEGWRVGPRGLDQAEFLFSAVAGEEPRPLARIASGGELSRTMLALKVVLAAADATPVLVFDEVDAGIGGKTADAVGRKLREVARARQVLCITHLPQIASYADHHLRVEKRAEGERRATRVSVLAKAERVSEIARMLGGDTVTDTSRQHALELIDQARRR